MSAHLALVPQPLPECLLCERPTVRNTWTANGGLCTDCHTGVRRATGLLPPVLPADQ
jgi:hypothetical protein